MSWWSRRIRTAGVLTAAWVAVSGLAAIPMAAAANPLCTDVILVLDESGSVAPHETIVRQGIDAFLGGVADSGVSAAVVEFGTAANTVFGYMPVTGTSITDTLAPYVFATGAGDEYNAPSQTGAYTNWDDALDHAEAVNASDHVAPLVLFITDGDPTAYNRDHTGEDGGITTNTSDAESLNRAVAEANAVKAQGSHILAIGVGQALSNAASLARLKDVSGPDVYTGDGVFDLVTTDVVLIPEFSQLPAAMALIAAAMCAEPAIEITKTADQPVVFPGTVVTYTIVVTNTGNVDLHSVEVSDPAVPGCTRTIGDLAVGESYTYSCTTTLWAPLTNLATATGLDPLDTPVEDDDSSYVTLIATGTGTPGYWKNHEDVWPLFGDTVLIGDWNHNGQCDATETCLALTYEEAAAALSTPPSGDMTYNLARALVAAWENASSGNDVSCVADTIDEAAEWLTVHPIGSGVGGGDPDWAEGVVLAETLDDYNNGLLCADHRDNDSATESTEASSADSDPEPEDDDESEHPGRGRRNKDD